MKIDLDVVTKGQKLLFVYAKRRIAKVKVWDYDAKSNELYICGGGVTISTKGINFYATMAEAASELADYHESEMKRYRNLQRKWILNDYRTKH